MKIFFTVVLLFSSTLANANLLCIDVFPEKGPTVNDSGGKIPAEINAALSERLKTALIMLNETNPMGSNDPELIRRGLVSFGKASMLCGPTCVTHLMTAVRVALGVTSRFESDAHEIESLATFGTDFSGHSVVKTGMTLAVLKAALDRDLEYHKIVAKTDAITALPSLEIDLPNLKRMPSIPLAELIPPDGTTQVTILGVTKLGSTSDHHLLLVLMHLSESQLFVVIDPVSPGEIGVIQAIEDPATHKTFISSSNSTKDIAWVSGVVRVRLGY